MGLALTFNNTQRQALKDPSEELAETPTITDFLILDSPVPRIIVAFNSSKLAMSRIVARTGGQTIWEYQAATPLDYARSLSICSKGQYLLLYCEPNDEEADYAYYDVESPEDDDCGYTLFKISKEEDSVELLDHLSHDKKNSYDEYEGFNTTYNLTYQPCFDRYTSGGWVVSFIQYVFVQKENNHNCVQAKDRCFFKTISYDRSKGKMSSSEKRGQMLEHTNYSDTRMYNFGGKVYFFDPRKILSMH